MLTSISDRHTIFVTGGDGSVGRFLRPFLHDYRLRLLYLDKPISDVAANEEAVQGDITDAERMVQLSRGCAATIHLAASAPPQAAWNEVRLPNIEGAYNVFDAARRAGVPRLVFASSSNHVTGIYDMRREWPIAPDHPVRPDGLMGVTKVFAETLARYYFDTFGLSTICLRIGWVLDKPFNEQGLRMWLSPRDLGQLVRLSLETTVDFGIYYGVSNNTRNQYDISNARRDLGYNPLDDSEGFAPEVMASGR